MAARRRILKRAAIVLLGIIFVLVTAQVAWTYMEKDAFEERIERIRQAGDPLYTTDLARPRIPAEQNAAALLEKAATWLEQHRDTDGDSQLRSGLDSCTEDWEWQDWERATAYLETLAPYYAMLDELPGRPRWWLDVAWEDGPNATANALSWVGEARDYTRYRVQYDRNEGGRTERAARAAVLLLDLAERCKLPFLLGHMAIEASRDSGDILRLAQRQPGFDARLFRRIVDPRLAQSVRELGPPAAPIKEERAYALWVVRTWLAGDSAGRWDDRRQRSMLWRPMLYRDACRTLDMFERVIAECGARPEDAHAVAERLWREREAVSAVYSLTEMFNTLPCVLFEKYTASAAQRRMTRVVMALLEYRQAYGEWPQDLTALGKLPLDPYSGAPFVYERRGEGARIRAARPLLHGLTEERMWELGLFEELAWSWEE